MTGPPRDWDKELAEIDKIMAKQPALPAKSGAAAPEPRSQSSSAPARVAPASGPITRRDALGTWVRVLLGVAVASGVSLAWPYAHGCGFALYGYLVAAGGVVLAGLWGTVSSWKRRLGLAHLLALGVTLTGLILVSKVIVDRSGYPKTPAHWSCGP